MRPYILPLALLLGAAACHRPAAVAPAPAPAGSVPSVTATAPAESYDWTGSYELIGHGFPDGDRVAVSHVDRLPSGKLTIRFEVGPPGYARHIEAQGNTMRVEWMVEQVTGATAPMIVTLRADGDRIAGEWSMPPRLTGPIDGRKLR